VAELSWDGDELVVRLSALEKAESLHGDIRVPMSSVRDVEVLEDAIHAVRGLKFPGTRWPGKVAVGTFVGRHGKKTFAVVHHDTPRGLRERLEGAAFDELLVGCDDPAAVKSRLGAPS
jgi:hypothetical protein